MTKWQGWSTEQNTVNIDRVLRALLETVQSNCYTQKSIRQVIQDIDLSVDDLRPWARHIAYDLGLFRRDFLPVEFLDSTLVVTDLGQEVAAEFHQSQEPRVTRLAARRAVLLWRDGWVAPARTGITITAAASKEQSDWPTLGEVLNAPHSWFDGHQFTAEEVVAAADHLRSRGLVKLISRSFTLTITTGNSRLGQLIGLTTEGTTCCDRFHGDAEAMARGSSTAGNTFINHGTVGNAAAGPVGAQSTALTVTVERAASDLTNIIAAIVALRWIPTDVEGTASAVLLELQAVAAGRGAPAPAAQHAQQLLRTCSIKSTDPAIAELLIAIADSAALGFDSLRSDHKLGPRFVTYAHTQAPPSRGAHSPGVQP